MRLRTFAFVSLVASAGPALATTPVIIGVPIPGLGLVGVIATGVVAAAIAWWRMRK